MKSKINVAIKIAKASSIKVDEVFLFREMMNIFNSYSMSKAIFVKEVHGKKGMVKYNSKYRTTPPEVEIADLLLLTYNNSKEKINDNRLKISFLQAKYLKGTYKNFLNFKANIFQWELLKDKPQLINAVNNIPFNILNFRDDYSSLTTYGIFYPDSASGDIDFLYTLPALIKPKNTIVSSKSKGNKNFEFICRKGLSNPDTSCILGLSSKEALTTCSMDIFENQVLSWKVGAPINDGIKPYVVGLLSNIRKGLSDTTIVDEVIEGLGKINPDSNNSEFNVDESLPVLLVITDSSLYEDYLKEKNKG